ncbi:helix-turn-helix domain-containing protein [Flavobacterium sp. MXW15]|uniref:Helix-turn-helix domain-containing protein n=1 Tax=Xanthomonas chitinilytica TaxID=2989819 RepID=A0ABT3JWN4_9XANT|nr:helix-turn-helix transcriptional regulator [Xanthomonas sp. H13-6]MCW4454807.1 helix-turn-helix domain-containing protein [Flavobacterium sp. MXW15]MCW4472565.1 helix-turn-helix domain-containing protein [Xanthomonas sp. H13-6]
MPPSTAQKSYGQRLRKARKAAGWTQAELGRCLDVDPATAAVRISRYENGQHMPDGPTADALAKALRLPQAWFHAETDTIAEAILLLSRMPEGRQLTALEAIKAAIN